MTLYADKSQIYRELLMHTASKTTLTQEETDEKAEPSKE